jgi:hypothetical protein
VPESPDVDAAVQQIENLLEELGKTDPGSRRRAEELIHLLMELYGAGLARALEMLGPEAAQQLAGDKLLASLLLLHGLHPVDARTRVTEALQRLERKLEGYRLQLEEISEEVARVRVSGKDRAPAPGLAGLIERAITDCAPDITAIEIEGIPQPAPALVQITSGAAR